MSEVLQEALMMLVAPGAAGLKLIKKLPFATHGTDINRVGGILKKGLQPGSALDFTKGKWSSGYPVQMWFKNPKKGRYIAHNDYFTSSGTNRPYRVNVDLDQLTDRGAEEAIEEVGKLRARFPRVKFSLKGSSPDPEGLTKANLIDLVKKRYKVSPEEAKELAMETLEDVTGEGAKRMYGYKGRLRNLSDVETYLKWLEEGGID